MTDEDAADTDDGRTHAHESGPADRDRRGTTAGEVDDPYGDAGGADDPGGDADEEGVIEMLGVEEGQLEPGSPRAEHAVFVLLGALATLFAIFRALFA